MAERNVDGRATDERREELPRRRKRSRSRHRRTEGTDDAIDILLVYQCMGLVLHS
jgi:hypothetical protein